MTPMEFEKGLNKVASLFDHGITSLILLPVNRQINGKKIRFELPSDYTIDKD